MPSLHSPQITDTGIILGTNVSSLSGISGLDIELFSLYSGLNPTVPVKDVDTIEEWGASTIATILDMRIELVNIWLPHKWCKSY